jgi:hypothetical protein
MDVLEKLLVYLDPVASIPVNRLTQQATAGQHYWKQKLELAGYEGGDLETDYKSAYMYLFLSDFNADEAYLRACAHNNVTATAFLAQYSTWHEDCAATTMSREILLSTELIQSQVDRLMLANLTNKSKFIMLLSLYSPFNIATKAMTTAADSVQLLIINELSLKELQSLTHIVTSKQVATVMEADGCIFDPYDAAKLNLANTITSWLTSKPSQTDIQRALRLAIENNATNTAKLLANRATFNLEPSFVFAARKGNVELCKYFSHRNIPGDAALVEAIRTGNVVICRLLTKYSTSKHIRLANNLHQTDIYNILIQ